MSLNAFQNTFAGNPLDRVSEHRKDAAWLAERLASDQSLGLVLWNGKALVERSSSGGTQIAYLPSRLVEDLSGGPERLLFMGLWQETAVFAVDLEGPADPTEGPLQGMGRFEDARALASSLTPGEIAIVGTAKGVFEWRRKHRACSVCGEPTRAAEGGWKRECPACSADHFPRTDPVVIMLAVHGDRCMLGRQAACARELFEEAGLRATSVRYHSSQPWPFPNSLMIGLIAEVDSDEAQPDQTELSEVRWYTRDEARALIGGEIRGSFAPPAMAIAHQLIKAWAEAA